MRFGQVDIILNTILKTITVLMTYSHYTPTNGHSPDKAGRSEVGRRSVGGRSAVGERRSEVGRRLVGGWSEVDRAPVGRRSSAGRTSVGRATILWHNYWLEGEPRVNNCVIEWSPDRPPTGAQPTSDRRPNDLRPTSDRRPTDQPCLGYDPTNKYPLLT